MADDIIASLLLQIDSTPAAAAAAALGNLNNVASQTTAQFTRLAQAHQAQAQTAGQTTAAVNAATRAATANTAATAAGTQAATAAATAATAAAAATRAQAAATNAAGVGARAAAANTNQFGQSVGQARQQIVLLGYQLNDIATGIASGQSPFMILAQQGGQVYQILNGPGGISAGLANIRNRMIELATPVNIIGAALVTAATVAFIAWNKFDNQQIALRAAVQGLGREAGVTAAQLEGAARRGASAGGLSIQQGVDFSTQIIKSQPQINLTNLQTAVSLSRAFAQVYTDGNLQEAQKQLNDLLSGGAASILDFDRKFNLLSVDQRRIVREALASNNQNLAFATTLEALSDRTKNWRDTVTRTSEAFIQIKNAISDLMTTFGPFVDRVVRLTASFVTDVARGARLIMGREVDNTAPSQVRRTVGALADAVGATAAGGMVDPSVEARKSADATAELTKRLLESARAREMSNAATERDIQTLEQQRGSLQQIVGQLSKADPKWGDYQQALDRTTEAIKSGTDAERVATIQSNAKLSTNNAVAESVQRLGKATDDLSREFASEIAIREKLDGTITQLTEKQRITGDLTREEKDALSGAIQQRKSMTDETGKLLSAAQKSAEQDSISIDRIRARSQEERAAVALRETIARQRGQAITGEQAFAEQLAAVTRVREEDNQKVRDGIRDEGFQAEMIARERDLLFATADARAKSIAMLQKEQELKGQGIPLNTADAKKLVQDAGENAADKLRQANLERTWDSIKSSGVDAFTSLATAIASGTKAMDAMINVTKQLGNALLSGGLKAIIEGLSTQNAAQVGIGAAEAGVGAVLSFVGANAEKKKTDRQKMLDDAKKQADDAAQKADEINKAISTYLQRITAAAFAGQADTLANRLAQFDAKAQQERLDAMAKGGAAMNLLEQALGLERANIVADWGKKIAEEEKAIADRRLGYEDRIFAAQNDNSTFAGKVAEMERQFQREREQEIAQGGQDLNTLIEAQTAERLRFERDAAEEELRIKKAAFDDAKTFIEGAARTIKQYLDGLQTGSMSPLAPQARLAAAQSQFDAQLALAQGGDRDALSGITGYAGTLLEAAKSFFASSSGFQSIFNSVTSQLGALPSQISPEQFIVDAINSQTDTLGAYLASIDIDGDGLISRSEAANTFLASIFDELDTNGDGQLSQLELVAARTGSTAGSTASVDSYTQSVNAIAGQSKGVLDAINGVANNQYNQLIAANNQLATQIASLGNLAKITFNTATLVNFQNTSSHGSGAFRAGGWIDGVGSGTSDSNRIWASRGEYIVNSAQARRYGPLLERINAGLPLPLAGNDNGTLVTLMQAVLSELSNFRQQNVRAVVAGAEHGREGSDEIREAVQALVTEIKLNASRAA